MARTGKGPYEGKLIEFALLACLLAALAISLSSLFAANLTNTFVRASAAML